MSDVCMPLLVLNMGGEMIYILQQRLNAQSITPDKQNRVLIDVLNTMFSTKFVVELMKPNNRIYTSLAVRQIFDKLAHSSIMRLNTSSMDKLYDLMCMSVKYQYMQAGCYGGYQYDIINNHVSYMRNIVANNVSPATHTLITTTESQVQAPYQVMNLYQWSLVRYSILRFYQDTKVKISLFLSEGIQNVDGNIVISPNTGEVGAGYTGKMAVGAVTYASHTGLQDAKFEVSNAPKRDGGIPTHTELGANMYAKDKRKLVNGAATATAPAGTHERTASSTSNIANTNTGVRASNLLQSSKKHNFDLSAPATTTDTDKKTAKTPTNSKADKKADDNKPPASPAAESTASKQELNVLAGLLGNAHKDVNLNDTNLISSLFNDDGDDADGDAIIDVFAPYEMVQLQGNKMDVSDKFAKFDLNGHSNQISEQSDSNDLLDMMDSMS